VRTFPPRITEQARIDNTTRIPAASCAIRFAPFRTRTRQVAAAGAA